MKALKISAVGAFLAFGALSSGSAIAMEATEESCTAALADLGLPTEPYEFTEGFFGDKHRFGGSIECSDSGGELVIKVDRETIAEDGYFGKAALEARDETIRISKEKVAERKSLRDEKFEEIKAEYKASVKEIETERDEQLSAVRENNIPASLSASVEATNALKSEKEAIKKEERRKRAEAKEAAKLAKEEAREARKLAKEEEKAAAKRAAAEVRIAKLNAEREQKASDKQNGFHCLSSFTGAHRGIVSLVEQNLNDPDSFDHDSTLVAPVVNGKHQFTMRFRAKNGFGAMIVNTARGFYGHENCDEIEILSID